MKRQSGFTLVEFLIATALSLLVALTMTRLMAETLGTATKSIEMTTLTQQLRGTLQMMSRDVRRASYSSEAILCYANLDCATDGSVNLPGDITYNEDQDCFVFRHDRNHDGDALNNGAGAFRLTNTDGLGVLEAWTGAGAADCSAVSSDWIALTDPAIVDIYLFQVDDDQSYQEVIDEDSSGTEILQKIRKVRMRLGGRLAFDPQIDRVIENTIRVRNELLL